MEKNVICCEPSDDVTAKEDERGNPRLEPSQGQSA